VVFSLATRNRFWFGMISRVSTTFSSFRDAGFGKAHAALAFEVEWLGDYTDGENAKLTRGPAMMALPRCRYRRPCRP